jgi:hypothetical protein
MDSKKLPELKKVEKVKVRVSKNGKWLTHILPEQGLMATFSMNYYRSILKTHSDVDDLDLSDEVRISNRLGNLMAEVNNFNSWVTKNNLNCANIVIGQLEDLNHHFISHRGTTDLLKFISDILNKSLDESRKKSNETT